MYKGPARGHRDLQHAARRRSQHIALPRLLHQDIAILARGGELSVQDFHGCMRLVEARLGEYPAIKQVLGAGQIDPRLGHLRFQRRNLTVDGTDLRRNPVIDDNSENIAGRDRIALIDPQFANSAANPGASANHINTLDGSEDSLAINHLLLDHRIGRAGLGERSRGPCLLYTSPSPRDS